MKHPMGNVVILDQVKNLSFINVSRVGQGVKDSIRIQREILPVAGENPFLFRLSQGIPTQTSKGGESFFLFPVELGLQVFQANRLVQGAHFSFFENALFFLRVGEADKSDYTIPTDAAGRQWVRPKFFLEKEEGI
jgi:hypothetical protein